MTLFRPAWVPPRLFPFWDAAEVDGLRATIVAEAGGEPYDGMLAVGCVVRNRVQLPWWWGSTYREVMFGRQQFSCWWADFDVRANEATKALVLPDAYPMARRAAQAILDGTPDITGGACWYFNPHVCLPHWASAYVRTCAIGRHEFYAEV